MAHNNFDSLRDAIMKKAKKAMDEEVLPVVKYDMVRFIESIVYNAYNPIEYLDRRKWKRGGLADESVILGEQAIHTKDSFDYVIRNDSRAVTDYGELLTPLIVKGQSWALRNNYVTHDVISSPYRMQTYNKSGYTPYWMPRDFLTPTRKTVQNDEKYFVKKVKEYMNG